MSPETITWIWLGAGIALMIAEIVVPGFVVIFLGAAAVLVAGLRWIGLVEALTTSFGLWIALSVAMAVGLRSLVARYISSERTVQPTDEDLAAFGKVVDVVALVSEDDSTGRIRYSGTSWPARSLKGTLEPGSKARIVHRENLAWVVELVAAPVPVKTTESATAIKGGA